jgi:hypothetical protein
MVTRPRRVLPTATVPSWQERHMRVPLEGVALRPFMVVLR